MDKDRIIKGAKIAYFFIFLITPITFFIRVFLSRILSLEEFGLFYATISFFTLISLFTNLGLNSGLTHYIPKLFHERKYSLIKKSLSQVLVIQLFLGSLASLIIFFLRKILAVHYFQSNLAVKIIPLFAFLFLLNILFDFVYSFFKGLNYEMIYSSINPLRLIIFFFCSVLIYLIYPNNLLITFSIIWTSSFVIILMYIYIAYKKYKIIFKNKTPKKNFVKKIFKYGLITLLSSGAGFLLVKMDVIMITFFYGVKEVALYEIVLPIATFILLFFQPLATFLFPMISKLYYTKNKKMINHITGATYNFGFYLILPVMVIIIAFAQSIIELIFGQNYMVASLALQILSFGFLFKAFGLINFVILDGIGKVKKKMYLFYFGTILNVILNLMLIPYFSINGAALATSFSFLIIFIISVIYIKKEGFSIKFKNWTKIILLNLFIFLEIIILKRIINLNIILEIISILIVIGISYIGIGYLFKIVDFKKIKNNILNIRKNKKYGNF